MAIQRWNPFIDVRPFSRARFGTFESGRWPIPLDVVIEGEDVVVRASMPGVKPEDISVKLDDRLLDHPGRGERGQRGREQRLPAARAARRTILALAAAAQVG